MKKLKLRIRNGRVMDPANNIDSIQDIYIAKGKIVALGKAPDGFVVDGEIDATNRIVCPGLVDLRVHLTEPGEEHKATIASETAAAASAGITSLCCLPDTTPVIDTPAVATLIHERARQAGKAKIYTLGALTRGLAGDQLSEMSALKEIGCVGVSNALLPISNTLIMRRAMEYAATHDLTVFIHAEDPWLRNNACVHEGVISTRYGLYGNPAAAESVAFAQHVALIEELGIQAHFCHLSTARAVRMLGRAQYDGLAVTADVTAHHLHLTEMDFGLFNSMSHVRPPLRTQRDRDGLRAGVVNSTISAVCSDHYPHESDAKLAPYSETEPGISALETLLPLSLRLVEDEVLSLNEMLARLTFMPADILGIKAGRLAVGDAADICIFDPAETWMLSADRMVSRGRNTPFTGWEFTGKVTHTLLDGKIVFGPKAVS